MLRDVCVCVCAACRAVVVRGCGWLWVGWLLHYLPFWAMSRVLYFHHYFPAWMYSAALAGMCTLHSQHLCKSVFFCILSSEADLFNVGFREFISIYLQFGKS